MDNDPSMQNLSKTQQQEFIDDLQAHRDLKRTGVHVSNAAVAIDCQGTVSRISDEVCIS